MTATFLLSSNGLSAIEKKSDFNANNAISLLHIIIYSHTTSNMQASEHCKMRWWWPDHSHNKKMEPSKRNKKRKESIYLNKKVFILGVSGKRMVN